MAYTEAFVRAKIEGLEAELCRVETETTFGDRTAKFKSTNQIIQSIDYWKKILSQIVARPRQTFAFSDKGMA